MKIKKFLIHFVTTFAVVFVVNAIVVYLWNLIRYGEGAFNWQLTFTLAIIVGIILPLLDIWRSRKESQREASPLLYNQFPFPLTRGRG